MIVAELSTLRLIHGRGILPIVVLAPDHLTPAMLARVQACAGLLALSANLSNQGGLGHWVIVPSFAGGRADHGLLQSWRLSRCVQMRPARLLGQRRLLWRITARGRVLLSRYRAILAAHGRAGR